RLEAGRRFAESELAIELFEETLQDGTDYEHSTSYHRLVFEMFLSSFILLELNGTPMSGAVRERLELMAQFVADYTRAGGTVPQIGDNDDGRFHPEHWWWFAGRYPLRLKPERTSCGYTDTGFYIMQSEAAHVFVSAATVGMHGLGSHSHND